MSDNLTHGSSLRKDRCDGSSECAAALHVHGCFADKGNCDEPAEHDRSAACDHCDDTGEVLEPSRTPEEPDYMIPCANCQDDTAARRHHGLPA